MYVSVILTIVTAFLISVLMLIQWRKKEYPPGPFSWPIIGNQSLLRRLTREFGAQHLAFLELSRRYNSGVIALRVGKSEFLVVSGNRSIQTVLNSEEYDGRPWNEFIKMRNMGMKKGITMHDGPEWREVRAWVLRTFRTVGFGKSKMSELIKDELVAVLENFKEGGVKRMKPILSPAVINVLWTLAAGKRLSDGTRLKYFMDLLERRSRLFDMSGGILSTFPAIRYIAPEASGYNLLVTLNNDLKIFLMETINEHKKNYIPGSEADLIDMFLREKFINKESQSVFTDDQLVMVLIDLFLAGCSTTSTTLDFIFMNMIVHQDAQSKLQKEIDTVIPSDRLPDLEDRPKLPYTEAVLTESQRMWVVTPIIGPRRVLRDTNLDGYRIPKDTTILINIYSVNMDPNIFPDPHTFKPERFLNGGTGKPDEATIPFGKGRRQCPGQALAKSALFLLFVGVMQKFKLLPVPDKGPFTVEAIPGLTISPKPYEFLAVPR